MNSPKKRVGKACDSCRIKKTKCTGHKPCQKCLAENKICLYSERRRSKEKIYPRGYVELLEMRLGLVSLGLERCCELVLSGDTGFLKNCYFEPSELEPSSSGTESMSTPSGTTISVSNSSTDGFPSEKKKKKININQIIKNLITENDLLKNQPIDWENGFDIISNLNDNLESSNSLTLSQQLQFQNSNGNSQVQDNSYQSKIPIPTQTQGQKSRIRIKDEIETSIPNQNFSHTAVHNNNALLKKKKLEEKIKKKAAKSNNTSSKNAINSNSVPVMNKNNNKSNVLNYESDNSIMNSISNSTNDDDFINDFNFNYLSNLSNLGNMMNLSNINSMSGSNDMNRFNGINSNALTERLSNINDSNTDNNMTERLSDLADINVNDINNIALNEDLYNLPNIEPSLQDIHPKLEPNSNSSSNIPPLPNFSGKKRKNDVINLNGYTSGIALATAALNGELNLSDYYDSASQSQSQSQSQSPLSPHLISSNVSSNSIDGLISNGLVDGNKSGSKKNSNGLCIETQSLSSLTTNFEKQSLNSPLNSLLSLNHLMNNHQQQSPSGVSSSNLSGTTTINGVDNGHYQDSPSPSLLSPTSSLTYTHNYPSNNHTPVGTSNHSSTGSLSSLTGNHGVRRSSSLTKPYSPSVLKKLNLGHVSKPIHYHNLNHLGHGHSHLHDDISNELDNESGDGEGCDNEKCEAATTSQERGRLKYNEFDLVNLTKFDKYSDKNFNADLRSNLSSTADITVNNNKVDDEDDIDIDGLDEIDTLEELNELWLSKSIS